MSGTAGRRSAGRSGRPLGSWPGRLPQAPAARASLLLQPAASCLQCSRPSFMGRAPHQRAMRTRDSSCFTPTTLPLISLPSAAFLRMPYRLCRPLLLQELPPVTRIWPASGDQKREWKRRGMLPAKQVTRWRCCKTMEQPFCRCMRHRGCLMRANITQSYSTVAARVFALQSGSPGGGGVANGCITGASPAVGAAVGVCCSWRPKAPEIRWPLSFLSALHSASASRGAVWLLPGVRTGACMPCATQ